MSNTWKCDGPRCKTWSTWAFTRGIMRVSPIPAEQLHFCSWECIHQYSAIKKEKTGDE